MSLTLVICAVFCAGSPWCFGCGRPSASRSPTRISSSDCSSLSRCSPSSSPSEWSSGRRGCRWVSNIGAGWGGVGAGVWRGGGSGVAHCRASGVVTFVASPHLTSHTLVACTHASGVNTFVSTPDLPSHTRAIGYTHYAFLLGLLFHTEPILLSSEGVDSDT